MSNLNRYLNSKLRSLVATIPVVLSSAQKERHQIPALALMALTAHYWNGNKYGREEDYRLNPKKPQDRHPWLDREYRGHNIAALAVDDHGHIADFEFNHNKLFFSSVEHAESRLVRRLFAIASLQDMKGAELKSPTLKGYTIYTTLESCAQCAGIMTLGQVSQVVFLQTDPGMFRIGNLLKRLTKGHPPEAPQPISGAQIGLSYFRRLDKAYTAFVRAQSREKPPPFSLLPNGRPRFTSSITSFLCTGQALKIFQDAAAKFRHLAPENLAHPQYKPPNKPRSLSNESLLGECQRFLHDAQTHGLRGTPHRS